MKKFIKILFLILLVIDTLHLKAQEYIIVKGTVKEIETDTAIAFHEVFIDMVDSSYSTIVATDENGFFNDTILYPNQLPIIVSTYDYQQQLHIESITNPTQVNNVNFKICNTGCDINAGFEYNIDNENPLLVYFTDYSTGAIDSWQWDFGDGTYSNKQNPQHLFPEYGQYFINLFVSDSSGNCTDYYFKILYLGDSIHCFADFDYDAGIGNPLFIHFHDRSNGNPTIWIWDFGDNTPPVYKQNPSHLFSKPGMYLISLSIVDSITDCYDSEFTPIQVNSDSTPQNCEADFSVALDTLNSTPYVYSFTNLSQENTNYWYWDFGDGTFSNEKNPMHTYADSGYYEVCLSVQHLQDDSIFCEDTYCQWVETPKYYNFGGHTFIGDFPINIEDGDSTNKAVAYLYRKVDNRWQLTDLRTFWRYGYYWFINKLQGNYLIRVDLIEGSRDFGLYAPSYYGNVSNWQKADKFHLNNSQTFDTDIHLQALALTATGTGSLAGKIFIKDNCESFDPEHIELQLYNDTGLLLLITYTNENGHYSFGNLPFGNYKVRAEYTGFYSDEITVTLNAQKPILTDLNVGLICSNTDGIFSLNSRKSFIISKIYPLPADKQLTVVINTVANKTVLLSFYNFTGKFIRQQKFNLTYGRNLISLSVNDMHSGLYLLKIIDLKGYSSVNKKIIIKH